MKIERIIWLAAIGVIARLMWGIVEKSVQQKFVTQQLDIANQCKVALPAFNQRYRTLAALIKIYEKQVGWEDGVFKGNPNSLNLSWEDANSPVIATTKLSPELQYSQTIQDGLSQLNNGNSGFEKYQGALAVNDNLQAFINAALQYNEIRTNLLLIQLRSDLTATEPEALAVNESINTIIDRYNSSLAYFPDSFVAGRLHIQPIDRSSSQIITPIWQSDFSNDPDGTRETSDQTTGAPVN